MWNSYTLHTQVHLFVFGIFHNKEFFRYFMLDILNYTWH